MEPRFGHDLGAVRVHSGPAAERSAHELNAAAYTAGRDIVFAAGQLAPETLEGRRLIAHELAHVVQQSRLGPSIQRAPAGNKPPATQNKPPASKPPADDDPVIKVERAGDAWEVTIVGFTVAWVAIWPDKVPAAVRVQQLIAVLEPGQVTLVKITGLTPEGVKTMVPSVAKKFVDQGLVEEPESAALQAARAAFRANHKGHGPKVLDNIDAALKRVTKNNPDLLESYYSLYAHFDLTDDIASTSNDMGETHALRPITDINKGVLNLEHVAQGETDDPLLLLGETLIHEYSHTSQAGNYTKGPTEGKAYGIENFFAEHSGDKKRDAQTLLLGPIKGDKRAYDTAYAVMKRLYEVIDTGTSRFASLKGVSVARAREMSVEFVSKNMADFGKALLEFMRAEFSASEIGSLP